MHGLGRAAATGIAAALLALWAVAAALADHHDIEAEEAEEEREEFYHPGDHRLAQPGRPPVSNFFNRGGFASVDPGCYSGAITLETRTTHPAFPAAVVTLWEQIRIRPRRTGGRFNQRFRWELSSDPFELMGTVTTAAGEGGGEARVWLTVNLTYGLYRMVTDVRPRDGLYEITGSGAGVSRMAFEELYFGLADHHYSYVDLSGLRGAGAAGAAALGDVAAILRNRPPNVFMGAFDYIREAGFGGEEYLRIIDTERIGLDYGVSIRGEREVEIRIYCPALVRRFRDG